MTANKHSYSSLNWKAFNQIDAPVGQERWGKGKGETDLVWGVQWHVSRWGCVNVAVAVVIVVNFWQWSVRL